VKHFDYPPGRDVFELVATHASRRGVLTATLAAQLRQVGFEPQRIAGVLMVRASDWARAALLLDAAGEAAQAQASVPQAEAPRLTSDFGASLARQDEALRALHQQVHALTVSLQAAQAETPESTPHARRRGAERPDASPPKPLESRDANA
jgi:hypothetical protein